MGIDDHTMVTWNSRARPVHPAAVIGNRRVIARLEPSCV